MKNSILCLFLILVMISCKKDKEDQNHHSGSFSFSRLENYDSNLKSKKIKQFADETLDMQGDPSFDLGEIKSSKSFYFLLLNVGDKPIYDITLSSDNPNFKISPSKIGFLGSTKNLTSSDNDLIFPIITIGIEHGNKIDGNGYGDLLNMGLNTGKIKITGRTLQNTDTVLLTINPSLTVNAKIMDIRLYIDNLEINLNNPSGSLTTSIRGIGAIPYYFIDYYNKPIKIENTGNTNITLQILGNSSDTFKIEPSKSLDSYQLDGQYMVFTINNMTSGGKHGVFILESDGVAVNTNKLKLLNDGNAYFSLFRWQ